MNIVICPLLPKLLRGLKILHGDNRFVTVLGMVQWKFSSVDLLFLGDVIGHIRSLENEVAGVSVIL